MNEDFKKLKMYLVRLNTVVNELDVLEDWLNVVNAHVKILK